MKFTKYSLVDEQERVTLAMTANGGLPVVDLETSVGMAGLVDNVQATVIKIRDEQAPATTQV